MFVRVSRSDPVLCLNPVRCGSNVSQHVLFINDPDDTQEK